MLTEIQTEKGKVDVFTSQFSLNGVWATTRPILTFLSYQIESIAALPQTKKIVTPQFRTCYATGTLEDDWKDFQQSMTKGKIQLQELVVTMQPLPDLNALSCNLSKQPSYFIEREWPQYTGLVSRPDPGPDRETVDRASFEVRKLGFRDVYQAVGHALQLYFQENLNVSLFVSLPVYAKINSVAFDGSTLTSKVSFHDKLDGAKLVVQLLPGEGWGPRIGQPKELVESSLEISKAEKLGNSINRYTFSKRMPQAAFNDQIDFRLLLGGLILDEESNQVSRLLLQHPNKLFGVEFPLMPVLDRFCSLAEFSRQLLSPEKFKRSGKVFERAISWLLASSGTFCVLKLDEFEKLSIKDSKFAVGSVDLLAYAPQYSAIYVISCTVTLPQDKEIAGIRECADYLTKEVFRDRPVRLQATLVTAKTDTSRVREECIKRGVQLVDGNEMKNLIESLRLGDANGFRGFWGLH